ncbi:MAG: translation initiation factor IF-2 [Elusimicrobia bacterium]|nr:translation initiation factor IF-2 [Elusimicrobiota bacterium]
MSPKKTKNDENLSEDKKAGTVPAAEGSAPKKAKKTAAVKADEKKPAAKKITAHPPKAKAAEAVGASDPVSKVKKTRKIKASAPAVTTEKTVKPAVPAAPAHTAHKPETPIHPASVKTPAPHVVHPAPKPVPAASPAHSAAHPAAPAAKPHVPAHVKPAAPAAHPPVKTAAPVSPAVKTPVTPPQPLKAPVVPVRPAAQPPKPAPAAPPAAVVPPPPPPPAPLLKLKVSTQLIVRELAEKLNVKTTDLIKKLMGMGVFATINQRLDPDAAALIAADYGYDLEIVPMFGDEQVEEKEEKEKPENLKPRAPIITIMGHVDHGKTTLLDALRESNIVDSEAGQITQHIGAYTVKTPKGLITVLDTPGHEAFTAMRAHGAKITDIVVLVVSAVDGVQPQTLEAINHAKAGNVPIIVAINKIDLPNANSQQIRQQLANHGLNPEEWGGQTAMVEISAKKRLNLDKLLDTVSIQAELMELKANPDKPGHGIVIESELDSKKGVLATIINVGGTIKVGDAFVVGTMYGKVRALLNDRGERLDAIYPSMPAELLGISGGVPHAGDVLKVMESEKEARHMAEKRKLYHREDALIHQKHVSLLSLKSDVENKTLKILNVILKTDVFGSMQAIKDSLEKLSTSEVAIHLLHSNMGNITESDVLLAKASDAVIFGFHVDADASVKEAARTAGVEIRSYKIIYDLIEDVKAAMSGMLAPEIIETVTGRAEIQQIFDLSSGKVAGSLVREGKLVRNQSVRLMRGKAIAGSGKISGLKRFKEDVREVDKGLECGILIEGFKDFQAGDIVEAITKEEKTRRITNS